MAVGIICLLFVPLALAVIATLPGKVIWTKTCWYSGLVLACGSLVTLVVNSEILIFTKGYNNDYSSDAMKWGLGQIIAMLSVMGQFWEIFIYFGHFKKFGHT